MKRRDFIRSLAVLGGGAGITACTQQVESPAAPPRIVVRTHRSVVGTRGVVSSADQQASLAGLRMLMKGGNAVDAAIATSAALNVVEPSMCGIGGFGGFFLIYSAREQKVLALDMMGTAPKSASPQNITEQDSDEGYKASVVPGTLLGWDEALKKYGTLPLADVFEPAIELAEDGAPQTYFDIDRISRAADKLKKFPTTARIFLPDGEIPRVGQIFKQTDLAKTLRRIASEGVETFYQGELGRQIVQFLRDHGGLFSEDDLANFSVRWREPIHTTFYDHTVFCMPPGSCGMTLIEHLNIVEELDLRRFAFYSTHFAHHWLEALKLAFLDDNRYNTGKDVDIPLEKLISKEYAVEQRSRISSDRVAALPGPQIGDTHTTHVSTADSMGNLVSFTHSLVSPFGSGVVVADTGILLNNGLRFGFVLDPGHINLLQGGQRAKGVMTPVIVLRGPIPVMSVGSSGGYTIPQTAAQVLAHTLMYDRDIQEAIALPRILMNRESGRVPADAAAQTYVEADFPGSIVSDLKALGHQIDDSGSAGQAHGVYVDSESGALAGGSDPRRDGHSVAL